MGFAEVREKIDQKDDKGFGVLTAMPGVLHEFKGEGLSKSGSPYKKVSIKDDAGELHNVTLRGTLPGPDLVNQRAQFSLSAFTGQRPGGGDYIGYSGFWDSRAQVEAPARPPAGRSEHKQKEKVDWDAKDLRMARMSGLNNATRLVCLLAELQKDTGISPQNIIEVADEFVRYIYKQQPVTDAQEQQTDHINVLSAILGQLKPPEGREIDPDAVADLLLLTNNGKMPTDMAEVPKLVKWLNDNIKKVLV